MIDKTNDTKTTIAVGCGVLIVPLIMLIGVALSLWRAVFIVPLWRWYAVPLGAPQLGYVQAAGICLLLAVLTPAPSPMHKDDRESRDKILGFVGWILGGPLAFLAGWLLKEVAA